MSKHIIHFYGLVTPNSFQELRGMMLTASFEHKQKASEISILISSEGGDLNSGFTAYNFIREFPIPVSCVNMGTVESIAAILFLGASQRFSLKDSRFLLHSFHWNFPSGCVDEARLAEYSKSLSFDRDRYAAIFKERTQCIQAGFDPLQCLNGVAEILNAERAYQIGITTTAAAPKTTIDPEAIHWWINAVQ